MLEPIEAPLECFGLSYDKTRRMCHTCPHAESCQELMGDRLERIPVGEAKFSLVPETIVRRAEEPDADRRDIEAIYLECWAQVYGGVPRGSVGKFRDKVFELAEAAKLSVPLFVLVSMFAHSKTHPDKLFTPGILVDGRALTRVRTYADVCLEHFGTVSPTLIDVIADSDLEEYDLERRMFTSEVMAAKWIIDYKLWHQGLPYEAMLLELENRLDPYWLATEKYYETVLQNYSTRKQQPTDEESLKTRHQALTIYQRMKKHKHHAISNFRTREKVMPQAIAEVITKLGYQPTDFEIKDKPVTDPLQFWNRLAIAIQHLECLMFVNYGEGIYAKA